MSTAPIAQGPVDVTVSRECPECGSAETEWHCAQTTNSGVVDGRLRMHDVSTVFYLGCNHKRMQDELEEYLRGLKRDAERYRFCVERNTMPVIAGDGETWCMFLAVKSNRRSLFTGATPSEAIDAAMNGANAQGERRP